ncbi:MAG: hypothetical protein RLY70_2556 [Planctomycetota bacterium]
MSWWKTAIYDIWSPITLDKLLQERRSLSHFFPKEVLALEGLPKSFIRFGPNSNRICWAAGWERLSGKPKNSPNGRCGIATSLACWPPRRSEGAAAKSAAKSVAKSAVKSAAKSAIDAVREDVFFLRRGIPSDMDPVPPSVAWRSSFHPQPSDPFAGPRTWDTCRNVWPNRAA